MSFEKSVVANRGSESTESKLADEGRLLLGSAGSIGTGFVDKLDDYKQHPLQLVANVLEGAAIGAAFLALKGTLAGKILPLAMGAEAVGGLLAQPMVSVWKNPDALKAEQRQLGSGIGMFGAQTLAMLPGAIAGGEFYANKDAIIGKMGSLADKVSNGVSGSGPRLVPAFATTSDVGGLSRPTTFVDPAASVRLDSGLNQMSVAGRAAEGGVEPGATAAKPAWDRGVPIKELAAPATGKGHSWIGIYRDSFPPNESDSVYGIRQRIADGASHLFETRGTDGKVLTFSLFDKVGDVTVDGEQKPIFLNSYNATRADMRGAGIGSKHMAASLDNLFAHHPGAIVPFEIDHTGLMKLPNLETLRAGLASGDYSAFGPKDPSVPLTPEDQATFLSRLKFYERLAERTKYPARVADVNYKMADLKDSTQPPLPGHLLYFGSSSLSNETVSSVVRTIYTSDTGYGLDPSDPLVKQVIDTVGKTGIADNLK